MRSFILICAAWSLSSASNAVDNCSAEIKILLSPATLQDVITSVGFQGETAGRVYFFDTDGLDLLKQGVVIRARQGGNTDLTVKVRVPEADKQAPGANLRGRFPCETNQTGAETDTDYTVRRNYKILQIPQTGSEIMSALKPPQTQLLREAGVSISWSEVRRVADISVMKWESMAQSPFPKLTLELWEWPGGKILELSAKVTPAAMTSKYAELRGLAERKGLSLSDSQGAKTSTVLRTLTHRTCPPR